MRPHLPFRDRPPFRVEVVILRPGANLHIQKRVKSLIDEIEIEGFKYRLKPQGLFVKRPNPLKRAINRLRGIKKEFLAIYRVGSEEPIIYFKPKVSPYVLKTVKSSSALKRALEKEFKEAFDIKKFLFIAVFVITILFIYLYLTGGISL